MSDVMQVLATRRWESIKSRRKEWYATQVKSQHVLDDIDYLIYLVEQSNLNNEIPENIREPKQLTLF